VSATMIGLLLLLPLFPTLLGVAASPSAVAIGAPGSAAANAASGIQVAAAPCVVPSLRRSAFSSKEKKRAGGPWDQTRFAISSHRYDQFSGRKPRPLLVAAANSEERGVLDTPNKGSVDDKAMAGQDSTPVKENGRDDMPNLLQNRLILLACASLYSMVTIDLRYLALSSGGPSVTLLSAIRGLFIASCMLPAAVGLLSNGQKPTVRQWLISAEMALYNLGSQGLFAAGLYFTDATLGAFLTQASVVVTPILSLLSGEAVPLTTWLGCGLAITGVGLLGISQGASQGETSMVGPLLMLTGAFSWSLYICRYKRILAPDFGVEEGESPLSPAALQTWKSFILALMYIAVFAVKGATDLKALHPESIDVAQIEDYLTNSWIGSDQPLQWFYIAFSGIGVALAHYLQGLGQKNVSSSEANVYLSSEPLFTAFFAFFILGEQLQGVGGYAGAALLVAAALASSLDNGEKQEAE